MAEDPNTDTGKISMDKAGLQSFRDDRVEPFKDELRKIAEDDPVLGVTMATLIRETDITSDGEIESYGLNRPLSLGMMLKEEFLHSKGQKLNQAIATSAQDLMEIYEEQSKLFKHIIENLDTSIETLFSTQNSNLIDIDGQDFLDVFEDVDSDMSGGRGGGGGGGDDD
ncbi:type VII secretion system-associated protein [Streptomyces zingiberis]|uniref:Type VII secretion system-associated protein n=1 Tax=Streptomyces zingiberis TaxID=2053010 RepID=A0ABX1C0R6_9ACTN|nr:type VII secretion system-associated protein [Streptomyces zingiberis]NJQ02993.1 type VII secretion system-associated protein [Streptomyces zingiberis]